MDPLQLHYERHMVTQVLEAALRALVLDTWHVPGSLAWRVLHALKASPCARAVELRAWLGQADFVDVTRLFQQRITPTFMFALTDDLRATQALTPRDVAQFEECILTSVDYLGHWKTLAESAERTTP